MWKDPRELLFALINSSFLFGKKKNNKSNKTKIGNLITESLLSNLSSLWHQPVEKTCGLRQHDTLLHLQ